MNEKEQSMEELWKERIQTCQESGLSQKEWCSQNQIPISTFGYWKRRLQETSQCSTLSIAEPVFAKLPTEAELAQSLSASSVRLTVYGIQIDLFPTCPKELMKDLIWALKSNA